MNIMYRAWRLLKRNLKKQMRLTKIKSLGLVYVSPNFIYRVPLSEGGIVIDAGCSYEADFSLHMIEHHGQRSYGVDPTRKHQPQLEKIEKKYKGDFTHLPFAISSSDDSIIFHESTENESGSILCDHVNVKQDQVVEYEVEAVSLKSLLNRIGVDRVAILKLDLEGAEYELLYKLSKNDLVAFEQIFIEFHHHAVEQYSEKDTDILVKRIADFGYKSYSLDDHNYLFYR